MDDNPICYVHQGPQREISNQQDLLSFLSSDTFKRLLDYLELLNDSVRNKKMSELEELSPNAQHIANLLGEMQERISGHPPIQTGSRFGNPAFRSWFDDVCGIIRQRCESLIEGEYLVEVTEYLTHSLGDRQRIDYGTGHEAHFLAFLYCLHHLKVVTDPMEMVLGLFTAYLRMIRRVQEVYWLEPAGSLGVWGLDDYHFLPFLFGSSQLADHLHLRPKSIHEEEVREAFKGEYLYYGAIQVVVGVKGPFLYQHSPMLDDISAVKTWTKVNSGLLKMYRAEVFSKLPVMQHFIFGRILAFRGGHSMPDASQEHAHQGDCCGNALPSAFPAASTLHDNLKKLPALPFD